MNNLTDWIADINRRGCTITITNRVAHVIGRAATWHDHKQVDRWRHALHIAADGTHPEWWNHIVGRPTRTLNLDDIPAATDDPDAFACSSCARPAAHLAADLTAQCDTCHLAAT